MTVKLDEELVLQVRRKRRQDGLAFNERVAINLFWRKQVRPMVLAKVFQCSKNTIYATCLTGQADSYMSGHKAREINDLIDRIGVDEAWKKYITDDMVRAVNAANRELVERGQAA